jgi:hypothetical protein|nr:MAG TPA: hypothetical protein [Bacteriophage sp.]
MIETITITGTGESVYEIPAKAKRGSVRSTNDIYQVQEVDGSLDSNSGTVLVMITPELPVGFKLDLEYEVPDLEALQKVERAVFGERIKSSSLKDIIVILTNIIERQNNLEKLLYDKVGYSELDAAVYPVKESLSLIVKDIKLRQETKGSEKSKDKSGTFDLSPTVVKQVENLLND